MNHFKILVVDDEKDHRETYKMLLESKNFIVREAESGEDALKILQKEYYPIVLSDVVMPGMGGIKLLKKIKQEFPEIEVIMVTGYGDIQNAVKSMKLGAFSYFIKSHNPEELLMEIEKAKKLFNLERINLLSKNKEDKKYLYTSKNTRMKHLLEMLHNISSYNTNVLLLGESGVGKEIIAKRIHQLSPRKDMPFVAINCQYFSDNLLESELFGHEKGSFTGANETRIGRFEEANGGTIFLDEIGEIPLETQVKFLRVLEERTIERIGSNNRIDVNFRLISATNRDLKSEVKAGAFREDLYFRINTITLDIPPLRERKEDIEDMIFFFIDLYEKEFKTKIKSIDQSTLEILLDYNYPGNIRELRNIIERMFVFSKNGILKFDDFSKSKYTNIKTNSILEIPTLKDARNEFEKIYITKALLDNQNNVAATADKIGISKRQLFNKIKEYNIR